MTFEALQAENRSSDVKAQRLWRVTPSLRLVLKRNNVLALFQRWVCEGGSYELDRWFDGEVGFWISKHW